MKPLGTFENNKNSGEEWMVLTFPALILSQETPQHQPHLQYIIMDFSYKLGVREAVMP